ncbi:MAG: hypothetical protein AAFV29_18455, partial [Myxococcota bacterium]
MILGFLGKGGSGKSSISTQMTLHLAARGATVLAVDADHNMDLSYNLTNGVNPNTHFLGEALQDIADHVDLTDVAEYRKLFSHHTSYRFRLDPLDSFTNKYSAQVDENLLLMTAGPQTEQVLYGKTCSHILTTPLKIYLPLLKLTGEQAVVV